MRLPAILLELPVPVVQWADLWGDGADGKGKNLLGVILMAVRKRIAHEDAKTRKGTSNRRR